MGNVNKIDEFEEVIQYKFKEEKFIQIALTHTSYANESKFRKKKNNERLEFLGDSVLSVVISNYIFEKLPNYPEGKLSKLRALVVCEESLAIVADNLNIGKYILLGKGEEQTGGRNRKSILADCVEAIIAAIYLDGGIDEAKVFILNNLMDKIHEIVEEKNFTDYKTQIQEYYQAKTTRQKIRYRIYNEKGPDHSKTFYVELLINNKQISKGIGGSKKAAEQDAAKKALISLGEINE